MAAETQAFLDEAKAPSIATIPVQLTGLLGMVGTISDIGQQAAKLRQLLQSASITEQDADLRAVFERQKQTLDALSRVYTELTRFVEQGSTGLNQFNEVDTELRALAEPLGYTI